MSDRILYVDDDANILAACKRSLGRKLDITTSTSGAEAIELIRNEGPFAVLLSDMRMPEIDGLELIIKVGAMAPDMVCMMLTGNADQDTAVNAVNKGHIFRFLTKPCPQDALQSALQAALKQYRLITAEKKLLQRTLTGSIKALVEVLEMVNPKAFARSSRIKAIVKALVNELQLDGSWQYEVAALLSQLGCIILPAETIDKMFVGRKLTKKEEEMFASHPQFGGKLLEMIPRLELCARMIEGQLTPYDTMGEPDVSEESGVIAMGAQIMHAAVDFDVQLASGLGRSIAVAKLAERDGEYSPAILKLLDTIEILGIDESITGSIEDLGVWAFKVGMYANEDIVTRSGALLVANGSEVTPALIARLKNFSSGVGVKEPVKMLVPNALLKNAA